MTDLPAGDELRRIFQTLPGVAMAIVTADGMIEYVNDAVASLYDASQKPFVGRRLSELFHPEFVEERLELIARALETRKPIVVDHLFRGRPISATIFPLDDAGEQVGRALVVSRHASPHDPPVKEFERVRSRVMDLGPLAKLSQRELEVFVLLGHGMSVPEVAARLKRSPKTIEQHKAAIGRKMGDSTLSGIARAVAQIGIDEEHLRAHAIDVFKVDGGESPRGAAQASGSD